MLAALLSACAQPACAHADEGVAHSGTLGTCTWSIDSQGALVIAPQNGSEGELGMWVADNPNVPEWRAYSDGVTSVSFRGKVVAQTCKNLFCRMANVTSIDLTGLDTSKVDNFSGAFAFCESLASLDLSGIDTSNATDMSDMFMESSALTSIDCSSFSTGKVEYFGGMFSGCSAAKEINVSSFDVSNSLRFDWMFDECSSLASLDLSSFHSSKAVTVDCMFHGCKKLKEVDVSGIDTANVTGMEEVFNQCFALQRIYDDGGFAVPQGSLDNEIFAYDQMLTGGNGTAWSSDKTTAAMACVDSVLTPGYFTYCGPVTKLAANKVTVRVANCTYTGKALFPVVKASDGSAPLTEGVDYTLSYAGNKAIGTATVTLKGLNAYSGKRTVSFKIKPEALSFTSLKAKKAHGLSYVSLAWSKPVSGLFCKLRVSTSKSMKKASVLKLKAGKNNANLGVSAKTRGKKLYF